MVARFEAVAKDKMVEMFKRLARFEAIEKDKVAEMLEKLATGIRSRGRGQLRRSRGWRRS
jgi:hypothetical protein